MLPVNYNLTFRFCFISLLVLFVLYFLNDLDVDSQYFSNIYAAEIANNNNNNNNNYDGGKERINFDYTFDSSEYFEEDNVPQNNNNNNNNNINNYNNRNSQLISQQQSE